MKTLVPVFPRREILDPAVISVPSVYGFFYNNEDQIGHLAMEKINGVPIDPNKDNHLLAVQTAMDYLPSVKRLSRIASLHARHRR